VKSAGWIKPHDAAGLIHDLEAPANVQRRRRNHGAFIDNGELGGAAADVDVEDAFVLRMRELGSAGTIGGEHRLHVMACSRGDEIAALLGNKAGDCLGILPPQRFAGQNDDAGIDFIGIDAGVRVGAIDNAAKGCFVDALLAGIGRERNGRLE
jgi:hypothetical protein